MIPEPTVEDTISILRGLKERYEVFHGVKIHDGARPLKRFIQSKIETLLARAIIGGNVEPETTVASDCENSALVIK